MAAKVPEQEANSNGPEKAEKSVRRTIPGDFSYTTTPGKLKIALEKITAAERPEHFNADFMSEVLGVSGGSAAPIPTILRRVNFLSSDNRPTELYSKFQSASARPGAALEGLQKGFAELFKRNKYVHVAEDDKVKDLLVEITGLQKSDQILRNIFGTFQAFRAFIPRDFADVKPVNNDQAPSDTGGDAGGGGTSFGLGLSYNINIVLPESKDISVYNLIFQSLRNNLLRP